MRASDEDALFCDFLEYYGVKGFDGLTLDEQASLAAGLPSGSRSVRGLSKRKYGFEELLLAGIVDQLRIVNWKLSGKKARRKENFPESILEKMLLGKEKKEKEQVRGFASPEEFRKRWEDLNREE